MDEELEFLDQLVRKIWETPHINIDHGPDPTIAGRPSLDVNLAVGVGFLGQFMYLGATCADGL